MKAPPRGFTLIELMIVVAIIAVLSALAIPALQDYLIRSQVSEGLSLASTARAAVWEYASNHGELPADNNAAGLPDATAFSTQYVSEISVDINGIKVTYGNRVNDKITGATLVLKPSLTTNDAAVKWTCAGGTLDTRYLPTVCR